MYAFTKIQKRIETHLVMIEIYGIIQLQLFFTNALYEKLKDWDFSHMYNSLSSVMPFNVLRDTSLWSLRLYVRFCSAAETRRKDFEGCRVSIMDKWYH